MIAGTSIDWRRNLVALYISVLIAVFGIGFLFAFIPLFLVNELGITSQQELAIWAGLSSTAFGVSRAITSPIWGAAADRFGRKVMLIRAMIGGGIAMGLVAAARQPLDVVLLTFLFGGVGGTTPIATAIAARETPRPSVGFAVGAVSSASALGLAVGPLVGSLLAITVGMRAMYLIGAFIYIAAVVPVVVLVRETRSTVGRIKRPSVLTAIRNAPPRAREAIGALLVTQTLFYMTNNSAQPLYTLQILRLDPSGAAVLTGVAFGAASLATAVAAFTYSWPARRVGYRGVGVAVAILGAGALVTVAAAPIAIVAVVGIAAFGLTRGVLIPAIASMISMEAPTEIQATALGMNVTAMAVGVTIGPLIGGGVAALTNAPAGLTASAALSLLLAVIIGTRVREPAR